VAALPFVQARNYPGAFVATAVLFGVFSLPAFVMLPVLPRGRMSVLQAAREGGAQVRATARTILTLPDLRRFLGAYFIYEDGVNTVIAFSGIFAAQTLGFPMERLIGLYIVVQISALLGALAWAAPTDHLGPRRVVMITLCQWAAIVVAAYFVETQTQFWVLAVVAGTGLGAVQSGVPRRPGPEGHGGRAVRLLLPLRQERGGHRAAGVRWHLPRGRRQSACRHPRHRLLLRRRPPPPLASQEWR
jgi:UMF1 family MFS transporter